MFTSINLLVWNTLIGGLGTLYILAYVAVFALAYDGANTKANATATATTGATLRTLILDDVQNAALIEIFFQFIYY